MGRLSLMVFSLAVLLLAANNLQPVYGVQLQTLVSQILDRYRPIYFDQVGQRKSPMFSLVVRIPFNSKTKMYDISQVTDADNNVRNTIIDCEVYIGTEVLAATVLRWPDVVAQCPEGRVQWPFPQSNRARTWTDAYNLNPWTFREGRADHAEYRTLQNLHTWLNNQDIRNDLLLIYVFATPCAMRCTNNGNQFNILTFLQHYNNNIVFVFSKVFKPRSNEPVPAENPQDALMNLGRAIGLNRIFRCDYVQSAMRCVNCNNNGNVAGWCYDSNQSPDQNARR